MNNNRRQVPRVLIFLRKGAWFYPLLFIAAVFLIGYNLSDYNASWIHFEIKQRHLPYVAADGPGLAWNIIPKIFNFRLFDTISQARFLSHAFNILNIHFRLLLYDFFPPPPGISFTGLLSLIITPFAIFRLLKNISGRRDSAWAGLLLYFLSTGFLSGFFMLFHPAKPLMNLLAVLCLYFASRISSRPDNRLSRYYWLMLTALLLAFLTDPTSLIIFLTVPLFFPAVLTVARNRAKSLGFYLLPLILFALSVSFIFPLIIRHFGYGEYNFWGETFLKPMYPDYAQQTEELWSAFRFDNVAVNVANLFRSQFVVRQGDKFPLLLNLFSCILLPTYCLLMFFNLDLRRRKLLLRLLIALIVFFVIQTFIQGKHLQVISSSYYYGSLFPIYFVSPLALILSGEKPCRFWRGRILILAILVVFTQAFFRINREWRDYHGGTHNLSASEVFAVWLNRHDQLSLSDLRSQYPREASWLFQELQYSLREPAGKKLD